MSEVIEFSEEIKHLIQDEGFMAKFRERLRRCGRARSRSLLNEE